MQAADFHIRNLECLTDSRKLHSISDSGFCSLLLGSSCLTNQNLNKQVNNTTRDLRCICLHVFCFLCFRRIACFKKFCPLGQFNTNSKVDGRNYVVILSGI